MDHSAMVFQTAAISGKWAWDCPSCGRWSRGFRYLTEDAARVGAQKHNVDATEADRRVHQQLYGPKGKR